MAKPALVIHLLFFCLSAISEAAFVPPVTQGRPSLGASEAVLINGRKVTPAGRFVQTQSYNFGMAISPDESQALLMSSYSFELVDLKHGLKVRRVPAYGDKKPAWMGCCMYLGAAFSADSRRIAMGDTYAGRVTVMGYSPLSLTAEASLNQAPYEDSYTGALALSRDGKKVWACDLANFRLVEADLVTGLVTRSIPVGRQPFALKVSPDEKTAWVCNVGMYEYPLLPGVRPDNRAKAGLTFPAYGVPSREAEEGTVKGGLRVPGLGDPNDLKAMSVFRVDLESGRVLARIKTGRLVGAERDGIKTVGGASPASLALGKREVYVANATNDTVSVIDQVSNQVVAEIKLVVPGLETLRGVLPVGVALSPDGRRLYAACAGLNAVAVMDTKARSLLGYIPAGWFCSAVAVSADGRRLYVSSSKGFGSGPNGGPGFVAPARGSHPGDLMQGLFQVVDVPNDRTLSGFTRQVLENTMQVEAPAPELPGVKHVVFIVKENRTFDQVFGQRPDVEGDTTLATLGMGRALVSADGKRRLTADVSRNHQALADRFVLFDNFYCDSDQSNTGHRWVAGVYPNEWVEVNARSWMEEKIFSPAPGRRYVAGSSAAVFPEDYNEAGSLWEHLDRHGVSFFNLGFGTELPAALETRLTRETGIRMAVSFPLPKPLFDHTSRRYPTFNMAIPDQYRADIFEEEMASRWESGREKFPQVLTMVLPQDHMADEAPRDGYPFAESYVADNDLALGRVMQKLSHSRWWKDMLVIVVEDDPQGGRDHVEAHRSLLMLCGPSVRRHYVSHTLADFGSIMKVIFSLLGLPPLNQFDAAASLPRDVFAGRPDLRPYAAILPDRRLFDPEKALKPFQRHFRWKRLAESPEMDDPDDMRAAFQKD